MAGFSPRLIITTRAVFFLLALVLGLTFDRLHDETCHLGRVDAANPFLTIVETAEDLFEEGDFGERDNQDPLKALIHDRRKHRRHHLDGHASEAGRSLGRDEGFLVPVLSNYLGDNNQLMEYMAAAVIARATGRTLCLIPFFTGPARHSGKLSVREGLRIEDRYDMKLFSKFVKIAPIKECLSQCNRQLDSFWSFRGAVKPNIPNWRWKLESSVTHDIGWSYASWTSVKDISDAFGQYNSTEHCVAVGGLFPGLRWRGAYLAASAYLRPTMPVLNAVAALQEKAFGLNKPYLAVHWRFDESFCSKHEMGLCFIRCGDGSVIDSGLHSTHALEWQKYRCPKGRLQPKGVFTTKKDLITAISEWVSKNGVDAVYIATDGWMRGDPSILLIKQVVEALRNSAGLKVAGLWKIEGLPNLSNGDFVDMVWLQKSFPGFSNHLLSEVEQEMCTCSMAKSFLGTGESTWSLSVFRTRLALRRARLITNSPDATWDERDNAVTEKLLQDNHAAGIQCRYQSQFDRSKVNATLETSQDEFPDGWLDIEACENLLQKGGQCQISQCL